MPRTRFAEAALTAAVIALSSCAPPDPPPSTTTAPLICPSPLPGTPRQGIQITVTAPAGWEFCYPSKDAPPVARIAKPGARELTDEGLSIVVIPESRLRENPRNDRFFNPETGAFNIEAYRNYSLENILSADGRYSNSTAIDGRTIGGEKAAGIAYSYSPRENHTYTCETWMIWHDNARWDFRVCSASDGSPIDPALLTALDTVTWSSPS